jgi:hypothetical protein
MSHWIAPVGERASWAETLDKTTSPHLNLIVLNPMSYMATRSYAQNEITVTIA